MKSCIEELAGSYFQIFADFQEVLHGRQGAPGRNGLDVTFVFAEIQAHLIFGYILFYPQYSMVDLLQFYKNTRNTSLYALPKFYKNLVIS